MQRYRTRRQPVSHAAPPIIFKECFPMSQAAFDLQRCDARVLDVALKYGYTSPTAFNRAFQKVHGIPPTAAKNIGKTLHAYPPIQFSVNITGGSPMAYYIAEKRELRFAGIRIRLCEEMEEMSQKQTGYFPRCFNQYTGKQTGHRFSTICL